MISVEVEKLIARTSKIAKKIIEVVTLTKNDKIRA